MGQLMSRIPDPAPPPADAEFLTDYEVAWLLRTTTNTIRAMVRRGELRGQTVGKSLRISRKAIEDWYQARHDAPDNPAP